MFRSARRGWCTSASIVAVFSFAVALAGGVEVCRSADARPAAVSVSTTDVPLIAIQSYGPTCGTDEHDVVWNGKGLRTSGGRARLSLTIPGQPVAAYLYLVGSDDPRRGGTRYPDGDDTVRAVIRSAAGRFVRNVPIAYEALDVFVNKLDITPYVAPGLNRIRMRGYGLNDPEGIFVVAVYTAPGLPPVRVDLFDGADYGYYPLAPPFGPDSEVVASTWPPAGIDREGRVWMAFGGLQPRRGDEILMTTGPGLPDLAALPDTDGDGLPDLLQRQFRLTRRDRRPLGNDAADGAGNPEALPGSVSLEEDKLGVARSRGGYRRGAELDLFTKDFTLPAGDEFAAFQVQSENPEAGDSFTLVMAATRLPGECQNPAPDYIVTKSASVDEGFPGDLVTYTFVVTNTGLEPLENIVVTDSVLGSIGTVPLLGIGESATLTYVDYALPACEDSAFTVIERCDGVTVVEDRCSLPNTVTAAWRDQVRTAVDCVEIKKRGRIVVVKRTVPAGAPDAFEFSASYDADGFALSDGQSNDSGPLDPGTYSVSELVPAGWTLSSVACLDPAGAPENPAAIDLQPHETVTCTFTNTRKSRIVVEKRTLPAGDPQTFSFTGDVAGAIGDGGTLSVEVDPGTYASTEAETPGWLLTGISCDDADSTGSGRTATFRVAPGEVVTCTFTNTKPGTIIVKKKAVGGDGTFEFTSRTLTPGAFALTTENHRAMREFPGLAPGAYDVAETPAAGWTLVGAFCESSLGHPEVPASIDLQPGETVTCAFVNSRPSGTIIVKKKAIGGDGTFSFQSATLGPFELTTVGGRDERWFGDLAPGTYDVAELGPPPGWALEGASCDDGSPISAIELSAGETVTCTFTNSRCSECVGKVTWLRLRFLGSSESQVRVTVRADRFPNDVVFDGLVGPGGVFEVSGGFSPEGGFDGTLGTSALVYVNGVLDADIHTSCSQPIGPGQVWGSFEILAGESSVGGALCPLPALAQ